MKKIFFSILTVAAFVVVGCDDLTKKETTEGAKTHTHPDGSVHDEDHNPIQDTTATDSASMQKEAETHSSDDGHGH